MRMKTLGVLFAFLVAPLALAAQQATYLSLDPTVVSSYFSQEKLNISCSTGTWISGPLRGFSEHIRHTGPLGWCGHLSMGSGDYHIIAVYYYSVAGGTHVPKDPVYNGGDPRTTAWEDINSGKERRVTNWQDVNRDGKLNRGDVVSYDDGATAPVQETGTAAKLERGSTATVKG